MEETFLLPLSDGSKELEGATHNWNAEGHAIECKRRDTHDHDHDPVYREQMQASITYLGHTTESDCPHLQL